MSNFLIASLLTLCPGESTDYKGQSITNTCMEWMTNCMIGEGAHEPTKKEFDHCASEHREKVRRGSKIVPSDIEGED